VTAQPRHVRNLHIVTEDSIVSRPDWITTAASVLEAGGATMALHVRAPRASGAFLFDRVVALRPIALDAGACLVVNDRVDVALAAGVAAVHLAERSLTPAVVRALMGPDAVIGRSCHSLDEVLMARQEGADYAFAGTVFDTLSHPGQKAIGTDGVSVIVEGAADFPVLAIGGVDHPGISRIMQTGTAGAAVMRGVWDAPDPASAVTEYISALQLWEEQT
jgi:thiamine-phosphate diphosphorylase